MQNLASIPFSVSALVAIASLSLFLTALNLAFWRIHREDRTPLWLAGWLLVSAIFVVSRLLQYFPLSDSLHGLPPRILVSCAYGLAWLGYQLGNAFIDYRPRSWERAIILPVLVIGFMLLWSSDLVLTRQIITRSDPLGGVFQGVTTGPLYFPANLAVLVLSLVAPIRLIRLPAKNRWDNNLMALGYLLVIFASIFDFGAVTFNLAWPRLLEYSFLAMAFFFTYIQVTRLGRLYRDMDLTVQGRTAELLQANEILRAEVSERKQAQEFSQVNEELYRMLFESNPHPAWVYDVESLDFLLVNHAAIVRYGYSREEFLGMTIRDIRPPEDLVALQENLSKQREALQWSGPWKHRRKDGTMISVEILSHALQFNGRAARLVMANDITQRLQAEAALQESEEKYRTLVESDRDGIAVIQSGRVRYVNPRLALMRGESEAEILGQCFDQFVHPDDRARILGRYARRARGAEEPTTYETALVRKDGTRVLAELTTGSIAYQGKPAEIVIVRDISERKQTEETLQRQLREVTVLNIVATACSEATFIDGLIERVTQAVNQMLYPDNCGVLIADERLRTWRPHPSYKGTTPELLARVHTLSEGIAGRAMSEGRAIRVGNVMLEPAYQEATVGIQSELAVPIFVGGRVFGCVNAESKAPDAFAEHDEQLMTTVAGNMAIAIEKIRLLQVEKRRREEAEILYNTTRDLVVERDLAKLLRIIVERAAGMLGATSGALDLCEPQHRLVRCAVSYNTLHDFTGTAVRYGEGAGGIVAESGEPLIVEDYRNWPGRAAMYEADQPFISVISLPMRWQGRVIGVIHVLDSTKVRSFSEEDLRMLDLFANQAALAVENARLFKETSQRAQEAAVIAEVGRDISETLQLDVILGRIASYATDLLRARTCAVYLPEPGTSTLHAIAALGPFAEEIKGDPVNLGEGILGSIALRRSGEIVNNVADDPRAIHIAETEVLPVEHLMGVPVLTQDQLTGLIAIWRVGGGQEFDLGELGFLTSLAGQVGVAIQNARLFENLQQSNAELSKAYDTTLEGWARALELRDKETLGHSRRVTELTLRLARRIGVPESEMTNIRRGVLLHDIGKMGIPDNLLKKTGPLSEDEWVEMRMHPQYAHDLLAPIAYLRPALDIPYAHHERWNGSGYPRGLKGTQIPLAARMFMVVDVYDALSYDRSYRAAWPRPQVLAFLRGQAGELFDPAVTEAFLDLIQDQRLATPEQQATD